MFSKLCASALLISACQTVESNELVTEGIHASMSAISNGDGMTIISAAFFDKDPIDPDPKKQYITLSSGDHVYASHGGTTQELTQNLVYSTTFPTDHGGDNFIVSMMRRTGGDAPDSSITLPEGFTITNRTSAPEAALTWVREWDFSLTWSPHGSHDHMDWHAEGPCIMPTDGTIADDTGTVTIAKDTIKKIDNPGISHSCWISVTVTRSRDGTLDNGFAGGVIDGRQVRTIAMISRSLDGLPAVVDLLPHRGCSACAGPEVNQPLTAVNHGP